MKTTMVTLRSQQADKTVDLQSICTVHPDLCFRDMANQQVFRKAHNGFDSHILCTIKGIKRPEKISNPDICQGIQQPQVSALNERSRLHWFGHLLQCTPSHSALEFYHFELRNPGWKRLRGKPHTHWRDIEEDVQKMGKDITALKEATSDHRCWQ